MTIFRIAMNSRTSPMNSKQVAMNCLTSYDYLPNCHEFACIPHDFLLYPQSDLRNLLYVKIKKRQTSVVPLFAAFLYAISTFFHELKQLASYPLLAPRPPRFDSVALFKVERRSSLSFMNFAIFCSKFSGRSVVGRPP